MITPTENLARWLPDTDPRAAAINKVLRDAGGMASHPSSQKKLSPDHVPEILDKLETEIKRLREHPIAFDGGLAFHYAVQLAVIQQLRGAGSEEALRELGIWPEESD